MSFDRRITPFRPDLADERLRGRVEAERFSAGRLRRGDLVFWDGHVGIMVDASHLIHANGHHMTTFIEPLAVAEERIRTRIYGPITSVKRFSR